MQRKILLTAILTSFVLGACGVKGELKTPPPIFGDKSKQEQEDKAPEPQEPEESESSENSDNNNP